MFKEKFFTPKKELNMISSEEPLYYETYEAPPGYVRYVFKNVIVIVDGRADNELPSLQFRTYSKDPNDASLNQPDGIIPGVNMEYICQCIEKVASDIQISKFQVTMWSIDAAGREFLERRKAARLRLYRRAAKLQTGDKEGVYILDLGNREDQSVSLQM